MLNTDERVLVPAGDDCAVIACGSRKLVLGVDQLIERVHYLPRTSAAAAGRKLLARNISDVAAMGARPCYALVSVAAAADKDEKWLMDFHTGLLEEAKLYDVLLIGGDLARAPEDTLASLTIIGELAADEEAVLRSGAANGDLLYATGEFGFSFETEHHLNFPVRLEEGRWLRSLAGAMMDVTDGLLVDSSRLAQASGLQLSLDVGLVPRRRFSGEAASDKRCLTDGEDYELIFSVSAECEKTLIDEWPFDTKLTKVGRFNTGPAGRLTDLNNNELAKLYGAGFDHFSV